MVGNVGISLALGACEDGAAEVFSVVGATEVTVIGGAEGACVAEGTGLDVGATVAEGVTAGADAGPSTGGAPPPPYLTVPPVPGPPLPGAVVGCFSHIPLGGSGLPSGHSGTGGLVVGGVQPQMGDWGPLTSSHVGTYPHSGEFGPLTSSQDGTYVGGTVTGGGE